jgi:hypothetical protein
VKGNYTSADAIVLIHLKSSLIASQQAVDREEFLVTKRAQDTEMISLTHHHFIK